MIALLVQVKLLLLFKYHSKRMLGILLEIISDEFPVTVKWYSTQVGGSAGQVLTAVCLSRAEGRAGIAVFPQYLGACQI